MHHARRSLILVVAAIAFLHAPAAARAEKNDEHQSWLSPVVPYEKHQRIVFVSFEGATLTKVDPPDEDATLDQSAIVDSNPEVIPPFDPSVLADVPAGTTREDIIASVIDYLYLVADPYDIEFTTERPASGPYSMIVVGGTAEEVCGAADMYGNAWSDCGDLSFPNAISFVFPTGIPVTNLGVTVAHLMGVSFGLVATDNPDGVMYWNTFAQPLPEGFTTGVVHDWPETESVDTACGGSTVQDAHQILLDTIGPRGQDYQNPEVRIISPPDNSFVRAGDLVVADATDDRALQYAELTVDTISQRKGSPPYEWTISADVAPGPQGLRVIAYDTSQHSGFGQVNVHMASGDEPACDGSGDCEAGFACLPEGLCVPEGYTAGALGTACASDEECVSVQCRTFGSESTCTRACDDATLCPADFSCNGDGVCAPPKSGGCVVSAAPRGRAPLLPIVLLALATVLPLRRRGRR